MSSPGHHTRGDAGASPGEAARADAPARRDHVPRGILYMVGATILFASSSAVSKWQLETYPFGEVLFIRSLVSLIVCAAFILPSTGMGVFRTQRLRDHVGRGFSQAAAQAFIMIAFSLMPLADAVAINFSAPLFATLFSALLLGTSNALGAVMLAAALSALFGCAAFATSLALDERTPGRGVAAPCTERDRQKTCPGFDPGWSPALPPIARSTSRRRATSA